MTVYGMSGTFRLPHSFATGSAVINMLRQIGLAVGVAVLIAILGSPRSSAAVLHAYQRASWVIAALALAGAATGLVVLTRRPRATAPVGSEPAGAALASHVLSNSSASRSRRGW